MNFKLTEEQVDIQTAVRDFCERNFASELARECDREERFPHRLHKEAARLGFIGIHIPEEHGGQGYGVIENAIIAEAMCRADSTLGTALILADLGAELISRHGTENQREAYLAPIIQGEAISALALTEPARGSALAERLDTTATLAHNGYTVNGAKTLITNAPTAGHYITLAQTDPHADPPHKGHSLLIVPRDTPGTEIQEIKGKMGIRASPLGEIRFDDAPLKRDALLGEPNRGFYHTLGFINESRVEIAAQALGIAQGALDRAIKYAKERMVDGRSLSSLQTITDKLAWMVTEIEAARLLVYRAAWLIDQGTPDPKASSIAKVKAGRVAVEATDQSLQIHGGYGYLQEYDVERAYRDAKITEIYEGTTEIQRNTIARYLLRA